jgi:Holliday junction resolvase RusA-like endonuclease
MRWTEEELAVFNKNRALPSRVDAPFHNPAALRIELPMPPTTNNLFATDRASGRRFRTSDYQAWVKAGWRLAAQRAPLMAGRVSLLLEVEEPKTKRRQDVANREKAVVDLLVAHCVIGGDCQNFVREITLRWADVTGVRVTVSPCK